MHTLPKAVTLPTNAILLAAALVPGIWAVSNQIDMRNVSGYVNTPACVQDCLYCCHDVAWQSACYTNECFCLASQFADRLNYVEYCVTVQCGGNVSNIVAATSIVKSYCLSSLWTSVYAPVTDAAATEPTGSIEITVPAGFFFQAPSSASASPGTTDTAIAAASTSPLGSLPVTQSNSPASTSAMASTSASSNSGPTSSGITFGVTTFNGGPLLTGTCGTPSYSTVQSTITGIFTAVAFPFVGCFMERLSCCPFPGSPQGDPYVDLPLSSQALSECPQDYSTVGSGCCPTGFSMYDMALSSGGPTPCFSSLISALTYPTTTGGISNDPAETWSVFALSLPLQTQTGLSTGAEAGIGVGAAAGGILILTAGFFLFRICYSRSYRSTPKSSAANTSHKLELDGQQVSEVPGNSLHIVDDYDARTNIQREHLAELQEDQKVGRQELSNGEHNIIYQLQ